MLIIRLSGGDSVIYSVYQAGIRQSTVTVSAVRGDIYDCNGKLLVTSRKIKNMAITYEAIPNSSQELNESLARIAETIRATGVATEEQLFPIYGTYPNYGYYAEATDKTTPYYAGLQKVLYALDLDENTSCEKLINTIVTRYKIKKSNLTDAEIDDVIRIRYDMLRKGFGVYTEYVIARDVDDRVITYVEELDIRGVEFRETIERVYCYPGYASHILGQVGKIPDGQMDAYIAAGYPMDAVVGISGCEEAFEAYLHGIDGKMTREYDESGNLINHYYEETPTAGMDIYLTIDIDVQIAAEDALKENIENIAESGGALSGGDADAGAIVAIDPETFSVLAIASYPTYDLSTYNLTYGDLVTDETLPLLNRALSGTYEPGSTFKIGVALAALEEGIITSSTEINDTGIYTYYPGYQPRCWIYTEDGHGHGPITVRKAIEVSCNYFFYEVGRLLGIDRMTEYMAKLGLGKSTGIELGEKTGILASPTYRDENGETPWTSGDTLQAAIGQSNNLFSPLQIACYFATVFNGGTRYTAHLLSGVKEFFTGKDVYTTAVTVQDTVSFSDKTYSTLLSGVLDVVEENGILSKYFKTLADAGVTVGGKTGTAQVSGNSSDNALFAAYGEYNGKKLVSVCLIEHGSSGSYAGYTVSKVMEQYFLSEASDG